MEPLVSHENEQVERLINSTAKALVIGAFLDSDLELEPEDQEKLRMMGIELATDALFEAKETCDL